METNKDKTNQEGPLPHADEDTCWVRCIHQDRVEEARKNAVPDRDLQRLADTYKALGDPSRLRILMALSRGEMCVCDLAAYLEISESGVSHQLRRLRDLALVKNRRDGKILYYSLDDDHVFRLVALGLEHVRE
ncbi:MAG: helix-turn-helix transcriptional regulator [Desulfatibacillum sp.]|nr:helix-turn-helix transcriptional regulator [Desulfatibacillum sp.]